MSAKKYVPNRLRGVLGGDDASPSARVSSSARAKGKKARPWRVDAASWKQQLQERKAVYDNFALQEKAEEEKEASSQVPKKEEEFESIPLNVLTSTTAGGGGRVEAMLTPNRGGQVETVFTSSTPKPVSPSSSAASPSFSTGNSQTADKSNDDYDTISRQDSYLSNSSKSSSSKLRRPSPLPRNRKTTRKAKRSPSGNTETSPHRTKRVADFNDNNSASDDGDSETGDWMNDSSNSKEYYIDISGGVTKAETIGLPGGEGESSSDIPVNKSSMMAAVEDFIDPSRANSKLNSSRTPIFARRGGGAEVVVRDIPNRRGGRRRQSPKTSESQATQPQLSPPTSTTSTTGTIMGDSSYQDSIFRVTQDNVGLKSTSGVDDEWSIRPIPSEEEICLEKRRWPLREDADTATMSSGDTEMISVAPNDVVIIPSTSKNKKSQRDQQISLSSSPSKQNDNGIAASSSKEKAMKTPERGNHGSGEVPSTTGKGVTPDPLQKARKSLLVSNLNRSVRSLLDSSSHSRQDTDTIGDSSIESSFSTSIFVPLRSRQEPPISQNDGAKEIPLNVLDDHGVFVSQYNKNGIYVPPNKTAEESTMDSSTKETADDVYNELGAYVPRDKNEALNDDNTVEQKGQSDGNGSAHESVSTRSLESAQTDNMAESSKMIANIDSGRDVDKDHDHDEDSSGVDDVENSEGSIGFTQETEQKVTAVEDSEAKALSQDQLEAETASSKGNSDGANLQQEGNSFGEDTENDDKNEFDVVASGDDSKVTVDQKTTSSENQIEDTTDINDDGNIDDDYAVDEIDANRIRLISALKQRVTSIYIGNHICIESIGTSEDEDPLATARQKRAARKAAYNAHLKVQLNDTVTALNTDHHHVVESPGKVKSVKGKKWKERMAMKKLSKKNGADTKNEEKMDPPFQEPTDHDALEEQSDAVASVQKSEMNASGVEKSEGEIEEKIKDLSPVDNLKEIDDIIENSIEREIAETTKIANENAFFGQTEDDMVEPRGSDDEINRSSHEAADEPENTSAASVVKEIDSIPDATNCAHEHSEEAKSDNIVSVAKETEQIGLSNQDDSPIASDATHGTSGKATNSAEFISISKEEEIDHVTPDAVHDTSDSARDTPEETMRENIPSNSSEPEDIRPTTGEKSPENIEETLALSEEPEGPSLKSTPEKVLEVNHDAATFVISEERQGNDTDLPISTDDNNIIQGLPPNKGKKWKDRLRKKKNKKSEKNGATTQDNSEAGEGANEITITETVDNTQATILVSPSNSYDEDATNMNSKARPSFNRNLSDLTAEEKQRAVSPTNVVQTEPPPTNVGKKSNKWKNRLAKIKGSKQENTKPVQTDTEVNDSAGTTDRGQILVDFKSPNTTAVVKPNLPSGDSDRGQILVDFKSPTMSPVVKHEEPPGSADRGQILVDFRRPDASPSGASEPINKQTLLGAPDTPKHLGKNETDVPTETMTEDLSNIQTANQNALKKQDSQMHQNLKQSFDVFDAFLKNGLDDPTDEQSLYTEMTIGQETFLQSGLPVAHGSEEELSYMDFTIEDTVQPSFVEQNTASKAAPKAVGMSPFMSNLLSSRMFQDDAPIIPKMSLPKAEEPEKQIKTADSPENLKKYPTITVGDAFDDDMTQITMGSLEDHDEKENGDEEFFDAESKPLPRSPSSKSIGKQSNSGKSESGSSNTSQLPCSETSKQRIVEILRKEVWSRNKDVVKSAIEELDTEARNGHHHRAHIVRCGGVMTIMRAMEMNSDSAAIQIVSCSTLETLALDPQTQIAICEMEGISLIVRSMQVHFENVELQESSCSALATICRHHETSISKDSMKDAEEAVPTILSCMTRYPTNTSIQAKGFKAVANLCSGSHAHQRLEELSKAGGIMTLTMALQTPWENKNDQHEAISNLSILLRGVTEIKEKSSSVPVTDIKEKPSSVPTTDESLNASKKDGSSEQRNEAESAAYEEGDNGEVPSDNETVTSYMSEIPDMPMMSDMSINCEEIPDLDQYPPDLDQYPPDLDQYPPDLDQYPAMVSNVEWQNFGEDDLDAGRKTSVDPTSPAKAGAQQEGADKEQCVIQ